MEHGGFGNRLRQARITGGLSQEALARRAGLSPDTVAALENGRRRNPRASTATALATALGLSGPARIALLAGAAVPPRKAQVLGRDGDIAAIVRLLPPAGNTRFLTLVGPGGVGKTALAKAVADQLSDQFSDRHAVIDVSLTTEADLAVPVIGRALGLTGTPATVAQLARALARHRGLLVLDGAEQLAGAGDLVRALLRHSATLAVVVTSRLALGGEEERHFPVRPLPVPPVNAELDTLLANPAVQLFAQRATAVAPEFTVDAANASVVAELCASVGGIPLALELAASRMSLLSLPALVERLHRPLDILTSGHRRTRSLRATLDWSYDLLDPAARRVFATLAAFHGGFDVAAVEAVHGDPTVVLDALQALVDVGLLVRGSLAVGRLSMLDPVREYARERLGAAEPEVSRRHLVHYVDLAEQVVPELTGTRQTEYLALLERDHDNFLAALRFATGHAPYEALRLAGALWRFWQLRGYLVEGQRQVTAVLTAHSGFTDLRGPLTYGAAVLCFSQGDLAAAAGWARDSLRLHRNAGDERGTAKVLNVLGNVARERGDYLEATTLYEQSLAMSRELDDLTGVGITINNLGTVARYRGDLAAARRLHDESLRLRVRLGDLGGVANCLENLAHTALDAGDPTSAITYARGSLTRREQLGDRHGMAVTLVTLAAAYRARGDLADAGECTDEALALGHTTNDVWVVATALATMAEIAGDRKDWSAVARLAGTLSNYQELTGATLRPSDAARLAGVVEEAQRHIDATSYECAWILGCASDARRPPH
jgi:predicted ATPase/DNA-binding XRE family transcriptional regulator